MERVSKRSSPFFRLSPVYSNQVKSFAIAQGTAISRIDVTFHQPWIREKLLRIESASFMTKDLSFALANIRYGTSTPPPYLSSGPDTVPFVRATNIKEGEIQFDDLIYISAEQPKNMDKCLLSGNEIIVVRSGANTGDCAVVPFDLSGAYAAYDLILTCNPKASPKFVAYFLDADIGRLQLNLVRGRSAQPHVNAEEVSKVRVVFPSPLIQESLTSVMDEARSQRKRKMAESDNLLTQGDLEILTMLELAIPPNDERRVFATRFNEVTTAARIDAGYYRPEYKAIQRTFDTSPYPMVTIEELCYDPVGGATPRKGDRGLYTDSGIKFLRILNIKPNEIDLADIKYIQEDVHEGRLKRSQLKAGDVLMTITGRVGTATVVEKDILPANINQHIVRLRVQDSNCLPDYLAAYLNTSLGLFVSNRSVTGGTRAALDYGAIMSIPVPLPPVSIQESVVAEVQNRRSEIHRLRSEAETGWQEAKKWFEEQLLGFVPL